METPHAAPVTENGAVNGATSTEPTPPAPVVNRGGRPKGAGDKRPRKRRAAAAAPSGAPKAPKPKKAPDPLAAPADGDAGAPAAAAAPGKVGAPKNVQQLMSISAGQIAGMACMLMNMIVVSQASARIGPEKGQRLTLDQGESEEITRIGTVVLEQYLPQMSPEMALLATIAIIYTNKWAMMKLPPGMTPEMAVEMVRQQEAALQAQQAAQRAARQGEGLGADGANR